MFSLLSSTVQNCSNSNRFGQTFPLSKAGMTFLSKTFQDPKSSSFLLLFSVQEFRLLVKAAERKSYWVNTAYTLAAMTEDDLISHLQHASHYIHLLSVLRTVQMRSQFLRSTEMQPLCYSMDISVGPQIPSARQRKPLHKPPFNLPRDSHGSLWVKSRPHSK